MLLKDKEMPILYDGNQLIVIILTNTKSNLSRGTFDRDDGKRPKNVAFESRAPFDRPSVRKQRERRFRAPRVRVGVRSH